MVAVLRRDGERGATPLGAIGRGITRHEVWVPNLYGMREPLEQLVNLVEVGALTLRVADTYPPEKAPEAHRRLEAGGVRESWDGTSTVSPRLDLVSSDDLVVHTSRR
jgi:hypothetical protein